MLWPQNDVEVVVYRHSRYMTLGATRRLPPLYMGSMGSLKERSGEIVQSWCEFLWLFRAPGRAASHCAEPSIIRSPEGSKRTLSSGQRVDISFRTERTLWRKRRGLVSAEPRM